MAVIKLKIDKVEYDIQCKNGEEPILREIETQINKIISDNPDIRSLPQSKMLLMISLFLAADLTELKKEIESTKLDHDKIISRLISFEKFLDKINEQ